MRQGRDRFFLLLAVALLSIVLVGFAPRFFLRSAFDQPEHLRMTSLPLYMRLHGFILTLWYILLVVQAALIQGRSIDWHKSLGRIASVVAILVVLVSVPVAFRFAPRLIELGLLDVSDAGGLIFQAQQWWNDVLSLSTFSIMIGLGIACRARVLVHRRLMLFGSMALMAPAIFRLVEQNWFGLDMTPEVIIPVVAIIYLSLVVSVPLNDWFRLRRVPAVSIVGAVTLVVLLVLSLAISGTAWGMNIFRMHLH